MYLAGSTTEMKGILSAATDLKADAIHFFVPNIVFILAKNKQDYLYIKSNIIVGQSVLVPKATYENMHLYIKTAREGFKISNSMFYGEPISSILFTSDKIYYNESERLIVEADIISMPLKKDVEFKIQETIQSSYSLDAPYLRIPFQTISLMNSEMLKYKKRFSHKGKKSSDNAIRIEGDQLVLYFQHDENVIRIETDVRIFAVNRKFTDFFYTFSDRAFYLLRWIARDTMMDEVIFLPRDNYCVIEGYMSNMVAKVRTMLKNDLIDKIV